MNSNSLNARATMSKIHPIKNRRRLRIKDIEDRTGWSRVTIWRRYKAGVFPLPHFLGNDRAWFEDEIDEWEAEQMRAENQQPRKTVDERIAQNRA